MTTQPNEEDDYFGLQTLPEFVKKHGIWLHKVERLSARPDRLMSEDYLTRHWKVRLRRMEEARVRTLTTYFSQGSGHTDPPTAVDVLSCLISDAHAGAYDLDEFSDEFGYDSTSMKISEVIKIHKDCVKMRKQVIRFLGEELLEEALYETEAY